MEEFFFKIDIFFDKFSDLDIIGLLYSSSCSFSPNFYLISGVITTPRLPKMLWELESLSELLAFSSSYGLSYIEFLSFGLWIIIFPSILLASISSNLDRLGFLRSVASKEGRFKQDFLWRDSDISDLWDIMEALGSNTYSKGTIWLTLFLKITSLFASCSNSPEWISLPSMLLSKWIKLLSLPKYFYFFCS